jgi:hypothetical protein
MKKTITISLFTLCFLFQSYGQHCSVFINDNTYEPKPAIGLIGGLSGFRSPNFEIGLGYNLIETRPENKKFTKPFFGFSLSTDINSNNIDFIGENLNLWINFLFVLGLNQNYYKNADFETWGIKPFIGLEFYGVSFIYGYNIFLNQNKINELSNHVFSIRYFLPIYKFKKNSP